MAQVKKSNAKRKTTSKKDAKKAFKKLEVDFTAMVRDSKARKRMHSKYRLNKRATASPHQTMKVVNTGDWIDVPKTGKANWDIPFQMLVKDLTADFKGKGRTWAIETRAMMREVSPVLTGNLRDSVKILSSSNQAATSISEQLEMVDKNRRVLYIVGVSEKAILPPPYHKYIIRGPAKGKKKAMSDYNYTQEANDMILAKGNAEHLGYDFLEKWQEIARRNMERIFR